MTRIGAALRPSAVLALLRAPAERSTPEGRAHDRHRRVVLSAAASALAKAITIGATIVSVPLTLHYLGPERYGIWLILSSFTIMLSFADMGLGNGVLNAVAAAHGRDDRAGMRATISSGFVMLLGVAAVLLAGFAIAYPFVPWNRVFNIRGPLAIAEAGPAMAVFMLCFALAVPLSLVQKVQMGLQQGFVASLWQCAGSVLALIGLITVIALEGGLPWLVAALSGLPLVALVGNSAAFFSSKGRDLLPSLSSATPETARRTARAGGSFFTLQVVAALSYGADNLIIAQQIGSEGVAQFGVPDRMFSLVTMILVMGLSPLWPAYGEAIARGDKAWAARTLRRTIGVSLFASASMSAAIVLTGPFLLEAWVGSSIQTSVVLLTAMGVWRVVEVMGTAYSTFLSGCGQIKQQVPIVLLSGTITVLGKIFLVSRIGIVGIPIAGSLALILFAFPGYVYLIRKQMVRLR